MGVGQRLKAATEGRVGVPLRRTRGASCRRMTSLPYNDDARDEQTGPASQHPSLSHSIPPGRHGDESRAAWEGLDAYDEL